MQWQMRRRAGPDVGFHIRGGLGWHCATREAALPTLQRLEKMGRDSSYGWDFPTIASTIVQGGHSLRLRPVVRHGVPRWDRRGDVRESGHVNGKVSPFRGAVHVGWRTTRVAGHALEVFLKLRRTSPPSCHIPAMIAQASAPDALANSAASRVVARRCSATLCLRPSGAA